MTKTVLMVNLPWWLLEPTGKVEGQLYYRRGVRAGSRWPFTIPSTYAPDNFQLGTYMPYPWFMGSAAGWLQAKLPDANVILRDSVARGESYGSFDKFWQKTKPTHVIIEVGASSWEHDKRYIRAMKHSLPSVKIAVAGPVTKDLWMKRTDEPVDAWILGEYEKGSVEFVKGATGLIAFSFLTKEEMATQPYPMFDEEVAHHYFDANPRGARMPELTIWGSRGCPWRCCFCSFPATMTNDDPLGKGGRKIRFYPPDWIKGFIVHRIGASVIAGHPIRSVRFDGDTDNASDKQTEGICKVMKEVDLPWSMMCRADTVSFDTWDLMSRSGCFGVKLGFESGSQRVVDEIIGKKLDLEKALKTARFIQGLGMSVHGTFTTGFPGETEHEKTMTTNFITNAYRVGAISSHQLSGVAELPSTPLAAQVKDDPSYVQSSDGQRKAEQLRS